MTDVGWLVRSVVEGDQGPLDRGAKLPVEPDASSQGQQSLRDPDPCALDGVSAVVFQAELVLEGVEDGLDPLADSPQRAEPVGLITAVRASQGRAQLADQRLELAPGQSLVGQDAHARAQHALAGGAVQQPSATSRSPWLGLARHHATGMPSGAASTYSLSPQ